jgi:hypothetical protein
MDNRKPEFAIPNQSVINLITELHSYFRDLQSYYQISKGELISALDSSLEATKTADLRNQLEAVNEKIAYFHVLNNAISIADVVVHTNTMIEEFKSPDN